MARLLLVLGFTCLTLVCSGCGDSKTVPPRPQGGIVADPPPLPPKPDQSFRAFPANDPKVVTLPSGVKYLELDEGVPLGKTIKGNWQIKVHYVGWLENGISFDSSYGRAEGSINPVQFGMNGLVEGWKEALQGMKEGGRRLMYIPADKGYGAQDRGSIPPNSNMIFEVWLWEAISEEAPAPEMKIENDADRAPVGG